MLRYYVAFMDLTQWLSDRGGRTAHKLHLQTGLSLPVIARARKGRASLASAIKIHRATDRQVPVGSMTEDDVPDEYSVPAEPAALGGEP